MLQLFSSISLLLNFSLQVLSEISTMIALITIESSILQVWDFKTCKLKSRLDVGKSVTKIAYHRANGIVSVQHIWLFPCRVFPDE